MFQSMGKDDDEEIQNFCQTMKTEKVELEEKESFRMLTSALTAHFSSHSRSTSRTKMGRFQRKKNNVGITPIKTTFSDEDFIVNYCRKCEVRLLIPRGDEEKFSSLVGDATSANCNDFLFCDDCSKKLIEELREDQKKKKIQLRRMVGKASRDVKLEGFSREKEEENKVLGEDNERISNEEKNVLNIRALFLNQHVPDLISLVYRFFRNRSHIMNRFQDFTSESSGNSESTTLVNDLDRFDFEGYLNIFQSYESNNQTRLSQTSSKLIDWEGYHGLNELFRLWNYHHYVSVNDMILNFCSENETFWVSVREDFLESHANHSIITWERENGVGFLGPIEYSKNPSYDINPAMWIYLIRSHEYKMNKRNIKRRQFAMHVTSKKDRSGISSLSGIAAGGEISDISSFSKSSSSSSSSTSGGDDEDSIRLSKNTENSFLAVQKVIDGDISIESKLEDWEHRAGSTEQYNPRDHYILEESMESYDVQNAGFGFLFLCVLRILQKYLKVVGDEDTKFYLFEKQEKVVVEEEENDNHNKNNNSNSNEEEEEEEEEEGEEDEDETSKKMKKSKKNKSKSKKKNKKNKNKKSKKKKKKKKNELGRTTIVIKRVNSHKEKKEEEEEYNSDSDSEEEEEENGSMVEMVLNGSFCYFLESSVVTKRTKGSRRVNYEISTHKGKKEKRINFYLTKKNKSGFRKAVTLFSKIIIGLRNIMASKYRSFQKKLLEEEKEKEEEEERSSSTTTTTTNTGTKNKNGSKMMKEEKIRMFDFIFPFPMFIMKDRVYIQKLDTFQYLNNNNNDNNEDEQNNNNNEEEESRKEVSESSSETTTKTTKKGRKSKNKSKNKKKKGKNKKKKSEEEEEKQDYLPVRYFEKKSSSYPKTWKLVMINLKWCIIQL